MQEIRDSLHAIDAEAAVEERQFDSRQVITEFTTENSAKLAALYAILAKRFSAAGVAQNKRLADALAELPSAVWRTAGTELMVFALNDLALYPLMDMADLGDLIIVDTMRISPADADFLSSNPKRLKGWPLGGFAGFLDQRYREWDLLWGRLDGAGRMIKLMIAAAVPDEANLPSIRHLREAYLLRAMHAILDEAARQEGSIDDLIHTLRGELDAKSKAGGVTA
jgi:hypothetical protein